ncbi:MAG: hypothetical protein ACJASC_002383 [Limimaricola cinnabarinus]|jgi:hypothetical protein|uniref:DUF3500 domain-containing protein n=1 Tax=Limimaricola cinnabarinus TaxID=1125964 RepID=UPI0039E492F5
MKKTSVILLGATAIAAAAGIYGLAEGPLSAQGRSLQSPPVEIEMKSSFEVPAADAQTEAIVTAAQAFLETLDKAQREAAMFAFDDATQRGNWSNFPDGPVQRAGVMRGDMTENQLAALDALLSTVMSEDGVNNVRYQLAAEDTLDDGSGGPNFGSDYYYVSFLGEPSTHAPWMLQFGGHHLAINVTIFGPDVTFSPMLTGGEPLNIDYEGQQIYITADETTAAQALMDSLSEDQKAQAIVSDTPINLLLGPGEFGTRVAPEGIKGSDLDDAQKALLSDVIAARLGFINADDFAAKMEVVEVELDDTWFGWWGPEGTLGAAYFRVTAPSVITEYAPQDMDGDPTDHAHNMYRDPANDYGVAWVEAE